MAQAASGVLLFLSLPEGVPPAPAASVQSNGTLCVDDSLLILWWMLGHDKHKPASLTWSHCAQQLQGVVGEDALILPFHRCGNLDPRAIRDGPVTGFPDSMVDFFSSLCHTCSYELKPENIYTLKGLGF